MAIRRYSNGIYAQFTRSSLAGCIYSPSGTPVPPGPSSNTLFNIVKNTSDFVDTYTFTKMQEGFEGDLSGQMTSYNLHTAFTSPTGESYESGDRLRAIDGKLYVDDAQYGDDTDWTFAAGRLGSLGFAVKGGQLYKVQSSNTVPSVSVLDSNSGWQSIGSGLFLPGHENSIAFAIRNGELYMMHNGSSVAKISLYRDFTQVVGSVENNDSVTTNGFALRNGTLYTLYGSSISSNSNTIRYLPFNGTTFANINLSPEWINGMNVRLHDYDSSREIWVTGLSFPNYLIIGGKLFESCFWDDEIVLSKISEYADWKKVWTDGETILGVRTGTENATSHRAKLLEVSLSGLGDYSGIYKLMDNYALLDDAVWEYGRFKNNILSPLYIQLVVDGNGQKQWIANDALGSVGNVLARSNSFTTTVLPHRVNWYDASGGLYSEITVTGKMI